MALVRASKRVALRSTPETHNARVELERDQRTKKGRIE